MAGPLEEEMHSTPERVRASVQAAVNFGKLYPLRTSAPGERRIEVDGAASPERRAGPRRIEVRRLEVRRIGTPQQKEVHSPSSIASAPT